jgi:ATP-dependent Lon protease
VLANVLQLLKLPDGTVKVLVEGVARVRITEYLDNENFFEARAEYLTEMPGDAATIEALCAPCGRVRALFQGQEEHPRRGAGRGGETTEPAKLADLVAGHLGIEVAQKQELLETLA